MHRIAISGLVALAAVLGGTMPAAASTPIVPAVIRPQPAGLPTAVAIGLGRISCGSAKACLAVGVTPGGPGTATAEAWNGTAWKSVAVHAPKGASFALLAGVSCKSPTYCLATGEYLTNTKSADFRPFAMTWNGHSLTPTPAPPLPAGATDGSLGGVSCVAVRKCVAVGTSFGNTSSVLMETWNGAKWALRTSPDTSGAVLLSASSVSCVSLTRCVVAGQSISATTAASGVLLASWNGRTLTAGKAPLPAGVSNPILADLSCASANSCVAVGDNINASSSGVTGFAFTEVWNGRAWRAARLAKPKGTSSSFLFGVSCASARACVAVGDAGSANSGAATAVSYNGKTWTAQHVPAPGKGLSAGFESVSCLSSAHCVAVGTIGPPNGTTFRLLSGLWNGRNWQLAAH